MVSIGTYERVAVTEEAAALLRELAGQHGPLMFHQSGGCCDGSAPMCYPVGMFMTGPSDVKLGTLDIDGMHCASCVGRVEKALRAAPGATRTRRTSSWPCIPRRSANASARAW